MDYCVAHLRPNSSYTIIPVDKKKLINIDGSDEIHKSIYVIKKKRKYNLQQLVTLFLGIMDFNLLFSEQVFF